jgi:hypothetical protein
MLQTQDGLEAYILLGSILFLDNLEELQHAHQSRCDTNGEVDALDVQIESEEHPMVLA